MSSYVDIFEEATELANMLEALTDSFWVWFEGTGERKESAKSLDKQFRALPKKIFKSEARVTAKTRDVHMAVGLALVLGTGHSEGLDFASEAAKSYTPGRGWTALQIINAFLEAEGPEEEKKEIPDRISAASSAADEERMESVYEALAANDEMLELLSLVVAVLKGEGSIAEKAVASLVTLIPRELVTIFFFPMARTLDQGHVASAQEIIENHFYSADAFGWTAVRDKAIAALPTPVLFAWAAWWLTAREDVFISDEDYNSQLHGERVVALLLGKVDMQAEEAFPMDSPAWSYFVIAQQILRRLTETGLLGTLPFDRLKALATINQFVFNPAQILDQPVSMATGGLGDPKRLTFPGGSAGFAAVMGILEDVATTPLVGAPGRDSAFVASLAYLVYAIAARNVWKRVGQDGSSLRFAEEFGWTPRDWSSRAQDFFDPKFRLAEPKHTPIIVHPDKYALVGGAETNLSAMERQYGSPWIAVSASARVARFYFFDPSFPITDVGDSLLVGARVLDAQIPGAPPDPAPPTRTREQVLLKIIMKDAWKIEEAFAAGAIVRALGAAGNFFPAIHASFFCVAPIPLNWGTKAAGFYESAVRGKPRKMGEGLLDLRRALGRKVEWQDFEVPDDSPYIQQRMLIIEQDNAGLEAFPNPEALLLAYVGAKMLHAAGVVHGDLHTDNIRARGREPFTLRVTDKQGEHTAVRLATQLGIIDYGSMFRSGARLARSASRADIRPLWQYFRADPASVEVNELDDFWGLFFAFALSHFPERTVRMNKHVLLGKEPWHRKMFEIVHQYLRDNAAFAMDDGDFTPRLLALVICNYILLFGTAALPKADTPYTWIFAQVVPRLGNNLDQAGGAVLAAGIFDRRDPLDRILEQALALDEMALPTIGALADAIGAERAEATSGADVSVDLRDISPADFIADSRKWFQASSSV